MYPRQTLQGATTRSVTPEGNNGHLKAVIDGLTAHGLAEASISPLVRAEQQAKIDLGDAAVTAGGWLDSVDTANTVTTLKDVNTNVHDLGVEAVMAAAEREQRMAEMVRGIGETGAFLRQLRTVANVLPGDFDLAV